MGAKPSSSANFPSWVDRFPPTDIRFWTDKSSWKTNPSSSAATPSSLKATKPSSLADKSPPLSSTNYTIPPGFDPKQFMEYMGGIIGGRERKFFLAMRVASAGLHYCFQTMKPIPLSIWLVILRDEGSDEFMDFNYKMGSCWNNDFDSPRVIAILQNSSVVTWNNDFNRFHFDDPKTVEDLRSKIGLRPLHPSSSAAKPIRYSLPPGFPDMSQFQECYGPPLPGMKPQYFLRIDIVLCFGTSFIFSTDGRIMPGCRRNSYFFVVFCDAGKEDVLEKYDGRMKTFPQDPHDPTMVFGYLKDGIINLDIARERLHADILNPFLVRLGLLPSVAKSSSSVAKSPPLPSFRNYTIPPGFHEKEFEEVFGVPFPGKKPQYFLAKHVAPGGLHYCFRTSSPILLSFWVVILRDDENSDNMDLQFRSYSGDWNVEFDAPRVLATLHNSNITWNSEWNHFHFDDPEMISKLRSKLGLPLIPPKSD